MLVDIDLWQPLLIKDAVEMLCLHLREHVAVAVVVVPGVRVIQLRQRRAFVSRIEVTAVPIDDHPLPVRHPWRYRLLAENSPDAALGTGNGHFLVRRGIGRHADDIGLLLFNHLPIIGILLIYRYIVTVPKLCHHRWAKIRTGDQVYSAISAEPGRM
mgnify:CR=1 FL=1